jgi:diaminohydroxyphosphoribosylaminopyrimidine deaminase / 5-amino-6-(5-phosphoribosylamino)uracil reductase
MDPSERASAGEPATLTRPARAMMQRALELAERGWGQTAPNPMVGAVLTHGSDIVGEGWHQRYGDAHAEVNAIAAAGTRARGAHLHVTLEPCAHHGRTPPCTSAIVNAGIAAVSIATLDPTAAGGGADRLREAGLAVDTGCEEARSRELNAAFFFAAGADRPWVTVKLAVSADGAIAPGPAADGTRRQVWLTGSAARSEVHRMRAGSDAIAVGIGTVLADDPKLTVRHHPAPRVPPARVVFDRRARIPLGSYLVQTARSVPTLVVTTSDRTPGVDALRAHGVETIAARDVRDALRLLRGRGIRSLLVEGGAGLSGALFDADCVDRLVLVRSLVTLGEKALDAFAGVADSDALRRTLLERSERVLGDDTLTVYAVAGHDV